MGWFNKNEKLFKNAFVAARLERDHMMAKIKVLEEEDKNNNEELRIYRNLLNEIRIIFSNFDQNSCNNFLLRNREDQKKDLQKLQKLLEEFRETEKTYWNKVNRTDINVFYDWSKE